MTGAARPNHQPSPSPGQASHTNLWDFRSIASIVEHDGFTIVKFPPGTSIDAITRKILDLGYSSEEFQLVPGPEPGLVDFRVFSDEEFPLYLCLSQIFNTFHFSSVLVQGEVFALDVEEIEGSGGRVLGELDVSFEGSPDVEQASRIQQLLRGMHGFANVAVEGDHVCLPVIPGVQMGKLIHSMHAIARVGHVHGTFAFDLDVPR